MSGNRNRNDSNVAKVAAVSAVGALLGLAAYGVKKVYDHYEESQKQAMRESKAKKACSVDDDDDDDYPSASNKSRASEPTFSSQPSFSGKDEPLQVQLDHYYKNYCQVPRWEMSRAKEVVDDVKKLFLKFAQKHLPEMRVVALRDTGSAEEGLKVIHADEFDVMIHLELDPEVWTLKESEDAPGYWGVMQKDGASCQSLQRQCNGRYLSPAFVISRFQSILQRMVNLPDAKYKIEISVHGPAVTLNVTYCIQGRTKVLNIDFVPAIEQNSTWVVAKLHPRATAIPGYENLWRQSFSMEEHGHLTENPNLPLISCHKKCLMIMKAIRLNYHAQFGPLSSYVLKTVLMHMLDQEDEWSDMVLTERIFDFLLALKQYLSNGELPNYFCPEMNLLEGIRPQTRDNIRNFIIKMLDRGIVDLLKTEYQ